MTLRRWAPAAFVAALAFALRAALVLASPGGLTGNVGDDAAAYYSGADALVHGRLPYRDFVLLHPPLLDLVLAPFAWVGSVVGDHRGFVLAIVAFQLLGAVNSVLVIALCRRLGLGTASAYVAGLFYAVWFGAVVPDSQIRLETLQTSLTLLGLLLLTRGRRRHWMLAGALLGASAAVKIWGLWTLAVVVAYLLIDGSARRRVPSVLAGAAAALIVVCGPFFVAAPHAMWRMVVLDQLGRNAQHAGRVTDMTLLPAVFPALTGAALAAAVTVTGLLAAGAVASAWSLRRTRLYAVLVLAQVALLIAAPSFFAYYPGLVAAGLAVCVGATAQLGREHRRLARPASTAGVVAVVAAAAMTIAGLVDVPAQIASKPFPTAEIRAAVRHAHCPTPDGPAALILTDTLSSTLADGCPNWVDVTGRVYDVDKAPQGSAYPRRWNVRWQRDLARYLTSGDIMILFRPGLGIGPGLARRIARLPLLVDRDGVRAYRVRG